MKPMKMLVLLAVSVEMLLVPAQAAGQVELREQVMVTFTKNVAPILQRSCQNCHRPGGVAPMPLVTYEQVRPWANAVKLRVSRREMPPWFIDKHVGIQKFKDDPSLSDAEIATIAAWVDSGGPRGNPADMPPPKQFPPVGSWSLGTPDLVVSSPTFTVKAVAPDRFFPLGESPTGLTEDRYIKAFEVREFRPNEKEVKRVPGQVDWDLYVIHHAQVGATESRDGVVNDEAGVSLDCNVPRSSGPGTRFLVEGDCFPAGHFEYTYNIGMNPFIYPDELGIKLKANSSLYFPSMHVHSMGRDVEAQVQVGFWFHPKEFQPKYARGVARAPGSLSLSELDIPAGMDNLRFDSFATLRLPAKMLNFEPHMHSAGKRQCLEAIYPDGRKEMLSCSGYSHAWVKAYVYEDDVAPLLPAGTILHLIGWYDNSSKNPQVLDPRNWKGAGSRSIDVMFQTSSEFLYLTQEEFEAEVAAREATIKQRSITAAQND